MSSYFIPSVLLCTSFTHVRINHTPSQFTILYKRDEKRIFARFNLKSGGGNVELLQVVEN